MSSTPENYDVPKDTFKESKKPRGYSNQVALMSEVIKSKPPNVEEALNNQVWKDATIEEYQSILKSDAWDIVSKPKGKSVVSPRWLYKIKHTIDGSIEKHLNMKKHFLQLLGTLQ